MSQTLISAVRESLETAMRKDATVLVLGEDVTAGGPFGLTKNLVGQFGTERVRNTPISESAVAGIAVGLALGGRRPVVDLMFNDFITAASDQLFNHAAKIHFMSGGMYSVPMAMWTIGGAGSRWGAQHSQRLDGWLTQVAGLKVLVPSSPVAAAVAMAEAIRDPDPVIVFADRSLLYSRAALADDGASPWRPRVVRRGQALTVAATGRLVHSALAAADRAGIDAEVIDVQCLAPLRVDDICESVARTRRALVLHDEHATGSVAATIGQRIHERSYMDLVAPVGCRTSPPTPVPAAPNLEDSYIIDDEAITTAMKGLLAT